MRLTSAYLSRLSDAELLAEYKRVKRAYNIACIHHAYGVARSEHVRLERIRDAANKRGATIVDR